MLHCSTWLCLQVRAADVKTISSIRTMLTTLQGHYLKLAGDDLPSQAAAWAIDNADKLHSYFASLALSIEVAAVVACSFGILAWVAAWSTMLLDFRCKVMQARRGIWTFDVKKTTLKFSFTFFGSAIRITTYYMHVLTFYLTPYSLPFTADFFLPACKSQTG